MTVAERGAFAACLALLGEAFRESVSEARAEAYFLALKDVPLAAVHEAVERALRECTFFPRPAELRGLMGAAAPDAGAIHAAIQQAKRRSGWEHTPPAGGELMRLVIERIGGWRACWRLTDEDLWHRIRDVTPGVVATCRAQGVPLCLEASVVERRALPAPAAK